MVEFILYGAVSCLCMALCVIYGAVIQQASTESMVRQAAAHACKCWCWWMKEGRAGGEEV